MRFYLYGNGFAIVEVHTSLLSYGDYYSSNHNCPSPGQGVLAALAVEKGGKEKSTTECGANQPSSTGEPITANPHVAVLG